MLTVSELARACDISRTAVLYYERIGLLDPTCRSDNGYRWYGDKEVARLKSIMAFRSYGIPVANISKLLDSNNEQTQSKLLKSQFQNIGDQINKLRKQQHAIVVMLQEPDMLDEKVVCKSRWVEIMKSLDFDEDDMIAWHQNFEMMKPTQHQRFLDSLGIDADEVKKIRKL